MRARRRLPSQVCSAARCRSDAALSQRTLSMSGRWSRGASSLTRSLVRTGIGRSCSDNSFSRNLPSAYVALKDTQQDDQWVVIFVRKTDFDPLHGSPDHQSARNRHGAAVHGASRGFPPPSRAGTASTRPEDTVDKAHHSRTVTVERLGAAR